MTDNRTRMYEQTDLADEYHALTVVEGPISAVAAGLANWWIRTVDVDYYLTATFNQVAHNRYRLNKPNRTLKFGARRLREAGYYGPYVMVAHDNGGTGYFHLHMLIKESEATEAVRASFKKLGDIDKTENGPIRGAGAFAYCANRACPRGKYDGNYHEFDERWHRRPRPRALRKPAADRSQVSLPATRTGL